MKGTAKTWRIYYVVGEALNLANLGNRKDIRKVYDMINRDEDGILGMEDIKFFLEEWKKENKQKLTEQKLRALENEILYNLANTDYHSKLIYIYIYIDEWLYLLIILYRYQNTYISIYI